MKQLSFIYFLMILLSCNGQTGQEKPSKTSSAVDRFVNYYNNKQYDSVFFQFSKEMKEAIPLENTRELFSQLQEEAGSINKYEFIDKKEGFDRYKAEFLKGIYWLAVGEDKEHQIAGLYYKEYDGPGVTALVTRNSTKLSLPFSGEWFVLWGGDTKEQNYHVVSRSQKNAFDFLMIDPGGKSFRTNGKTNEDYYAFGQPLLAPCDATVVMVRDGIRDNIPGVMNSQQITGNTVLLKTTSNEYLLFAHFKQNSIKVKLGDAVKKGQQLGLCGNSGNSSEPHLHFHIQDRENMIGSFGVKCFFEQILVNDALKTDYSPLQGDLIKNPK